MFEDYDFGNLVGKTLTEVKVDDGKEFIEFKDSNGNAYKMYHHQNCCEGVYLEDVCGSWDDIIGSKIVGAYETTSDVEVEYGDAMWTFYTIATFQGSVTLRWLGESNGYYSISVSFEILEK